jgi:hypothetical protein
MLILLIDGYNITAIAIDDGLGVYLVNNIKQ